VLHFLRKKSAVPLVLSRPNLPIMARVLKLGFAPFVIIAVDSVMIIAMNALLQRHGGAEGDALITCNTIVQSFMLVMTMPLGGISGGTQGILSYNYGAGNSDRVRQAQKYIIGLCVAYTALLFVLARVAGATFVGLFTTKSFLSI
jgi:Na+-driven multidrug efflux pump